MRWVFAVALVLGCQKKAAPPPRITPDATPDARPIDTPIPIDAPPIDAQVRPTLLVRLAGPFPTLAAYCETITKTGLPDNDEGATVSCDPDDKPLDGGPQRARLALPFRETRIFRVEALDLHCQLGIQTERGWFVLADAARCLGGRAKSTLVTRVAELAMTDGLLRLRTRHDQSTEDYSPEDFERSKFELLRLCGVGPSGVPHCTRELPLTGTLSEHGSSRGRFRFTMTVKPAGNRISITGDTSSLPRFLIDPLEAGDHDLTFP